MSAAIDSKDVGEDTCYEVDGVWMHRGPLDATKLSGDCELRAVGSSYPAGPVLFLAKYHPEVPNLYSDYGLQFHIESIGPPIVASAMEELSKALTRDALFDLFTHTIERCRLTRCIHGEPGTLITASHSMPYKEERDRLREVFNRKTKILETVFHNFYLPPLGELL
jgi:hypothetical protein